VLIRKTFPDTKVVILSALSDDEYVDRAITVGATGFLLKQTSSHDLSRVIREVRKGNTFFSPPLPSGCTIRWCRREGERFGRRLPV
jgi:DNA-binding NarL/FixJ family response regulator